MNIVYNETLKDIPSDKLRRLFVLVGWSDGLETETMMAHFNLPFKNSTWVISAWDNEKLVGVVRVLSDMIFRSVILDLIVDPEYQGNGIGQELVSRCVSHCPDSEWLVETKDHIATYYEKLGFKRLPDEDVFLHKPCKWF